VNLAVRAFCAVTLSLLVAPALAQGGGGGGRGRSEAITNRVGCFFVEGKVDAKADGAAGDAADPLQAVAAVREAAAAHLPALVYLFETKSDNRKREQYEQTMFGSDELGISLRPFRCIRLDVTSEPRFAKYLARTPVLAAYDHDGKPQGEVSQVGYKAAMNSVSVLLGKAAAGHVKPSLQTFVESYRGLVRDLEVNEARKKTARDRMGNLGEKDTVRRAALEKDLKQLDLDQKQLEAREAELLKQAQVPPRPKEAVRLGERRGR